MSERILNVKVGEPLESSLARAAQTMEALERGEKPTPYYGIGFSDKCRTEARFQKSRRSSSVDGLSHQAA